MRICGICLFRILFIPKKCLPDEPSKSESSKTYSSKMTGSRTTKIVAALRNLVINWPPLILFVACLVMFSCVTLVLGAYVYNTEGIADRDTLSWNMFLKGLEHRGLCLHRVPAAAASSANSTAEPPATASALVTASGWADRLSSDASNGSLQLLMLEEPWSELNVSLRPVSAGGAQLLCVRLWGAAARLPHPGAAPPPACDDTAPVTAAPAGAGAVELILDGAGQCAGGGARYRLEYTPATAWDITLSMADRERAYAHLTCTSAFLAVMALCMLTCTLVRNRSRYQLAAGDKVPLSDG